jgi:hypothetical protein
LRWCIQALGFIELPVDNVNSQGFYVSLSVHCLVINLLWQNAEAAENGLIFQLVSVFQRSVTHSRGARVAHQAVTNQGWSLLCACVQFQHSSLHFLGIGINIQNLVKIKGVP